MRSLDSDQLEEAWRLQEAGVKAINGGDMATASTVLNDGLIFVQWASTNPGSANPETNRVVSRLLISFAYATAMLGDPSRGLELLEDAERLVWPADRGVLLNQRGLVYWVKGSHEVALECFVEAEPVLREHGPTTLLVSMLLNRAGLYGHLGRYSAAVADLDQCAHLAQEHELALLLAKAWHTQGMVKHSMGDLPEALRLFNKAGSWYADQSPGMFPVLAVARSNVLLEAGLFREALAVAHDGLAAYEEQQNQPGLAILEGNCSKIALGMGDLDAAIEYADRARRRAFAQGHVDMANWFERLRREAMLRQGGVDDVFVEETLDLVKRKRVTGSSSSDAAATEILAARCLIRVGRFDDAQQMLKQVTITQGLNVVPNRIAKQLAWAELAVSRDQRSQALGHIRTGLRQLHQYRSGFGNVELQTGVASLGRELAQKGLSLAVESRGASTVFAWSERVRAQAYRLPPVKVAAKPADIELLAKLRKLRDETSAAERNGTLKSEQLAECGKLERQLRERSWHAPGTGATIGETSATRIYEHLGLSKALISYLEISGLLHALVLVDGRTTIHRLCQMSEVTELSRRLLSDLDAVTVRRLPERMEQTVRLSIANLANQLDTRLLGDLSNLITDRELVVIPTNLLMWLPWATLPSLRGRPVTVAPSASMWATAKERHTTTTKPSLFASGPNLLHAQAELDQVSALYADTKILCGDGANHQAVLNALDGAPIAHLAAHGLHEPENVQFSRLEFAGGPLMAYDIAQLETPPSHVTLSACDVGRTKVTVGDETLGFTAALLYAGTSTVISSGVKVGHEAAADIMVNYHQALVLGKEPSRALAEASLRQPLAPFVCYGAG